MRKYSALLVFFFSAFIVHAQNYSNGQAARAVLGQQNFTAASAYASQSTLGGVSGLAFYNGILYVADSNRVAATPNNSRIMAFPTSEIPGLHDNLLNDGLTNSDCYLCGFPAGLSLGQSTFVPADPSVGFSPNRSQSGMANATGVTTDGHYFAVADTDNNRVLVWNEIPTMMNQPADIVVGQTDFTSFKSPQHVDQYSLRGPQGVWIQNHKLFVADTQNNRVLIWNTIPTTNNQAADVVLGQNDFTHNTQPPPTSSNPTAAANQLLNPTSVTSDGSRVYVSDLGFNRVLIWNSIPAANGQNADVVVGQPDMTQTAANNPAVCNGYSIGPVAECQTSLNFPRFVLSNGTKLFIADGGNDRVLIFNTIPTTNGAAANGVLGEPDFIQDVGSSASISITSTAVDNTGAVDLLPTPQSLAYDPATQNLYVSDPYNRRVVVFTPGDNPLPPNSVVNWASEVIRQEGIVTFAGAPVKGDTASITLAGGTPYTYTEKDKDTLDDVAQGLVALINAGAGDANVTAIFRGAGTATIYLSSKATDLGYDAITLAASTSNPADVTATASGAYLSAGTAATGAPGMLVEINGTNLSDQTVTANLDGTSTVPNTLGGVQVFMDGYPSPVFKASPTQIVTQIPYGYGNRNSTSVYVRTVHSDGSVTVTNAMPVYIAPANPGIFNAPATPGQVRPWPIAMAYHQSGNPTAVISIDGSATANDTATITINGIAYTYKVVTNDTLATITDNLITLINASDPSVTASRGGSFDRVVLTAKQSGAAGNGITIAGSTSTNATVTVTAYTSTTCCVVTPGSPISPANPAGPGELITVTGVGLGSIDDMNGNTVSTLGTGVPYAGVVPNDAFNFVSATMGAVTAQVIFAGLPANSYGVYDIQMVVPSTLAANAATPLYIAQNAFISNTVTIPVGAPVIYSPPGPSAPPTTIGEVIDAPAAGATVHGSILASGWALNSVSTISGVSVSIDGTFYGSAARDNPRADVCAAFKSADCPNTGWYLTIDTTQFADGQHTIAITALSANGSNRTLAQTFYVSNNPSPSTNAQRGAIDVPAANFIYRGVVPFSGWSTNDNSAVAGVSIYVDGAPRGAAGYGGVRTDVCAIYTHPPNCPNVGWSFQFDTSTLSDGPHTLVAKAISTNGQTFAISKPFQVGNWSSANSTRAVIDSPSAGAGAFSGMLMLSGWAVDDRVPIGSVHVSVDGVNYGAAAYGGNRSDVCAIFADAGCPNVGFSAFLDTTLLTDGQHTVSIVVNPISGQGSTYTRTFSVANRWTTANPISAIIDTPSNGASVAGVFQASGWALSTSDTVNGVSLLVDGKPFGSATYGANRADVCAANPGSPGCPNVGWSASLDSTQLSNGNHTLEATITTTNGHRASVGRSFVVANATTGPGHITFDVPGAASRTFQGLALFSGWALNDNTAVSSLSVTIDGVPYGGATYHLPRPDVCAVFPGRAGCPNVGWSFGIDTTQFPDGAHTLGITENNADGTFYTASISFVVANYSTTGNPVRIAIEAPVNTTAYGIFGTVGISGWAINDYGPISAVKVAIDGVPVGTATYGTARADVCLAYPGHAKCPNVGWAFYYDTSLLPNGVHNLDVTAITSGGQSSTVSQQFSVAN